jgi:phosphate transport system substrate-binding protein
MKSRRWILLLLTAVLVRATDTLTGAGATFPYPLYQKWIAAFTEKFPSAVISYNASGSGAGIDALRKGEVDFAASDAPLSDAQLAAFPRKVRHIPTTVGGVVPIYHLEGRIRDLRFTPEILAGIYLGRITRWDDPLIKLANRGAGLPARRIVVVHRVDGSGTTYVWTDYLAKISAEWRSSIGVSTGVPWPVGMGASGNEGVANLVAKTADSIGYVEFIYALQSHLSYGAVRNASGRFVPADLSSLPAAASAFQPPRPDDLRGSITNAPGAQSYPIAAFTYFIVPENFADAEKTKNMSAFLHWILTSGQKQSPSLGYAALPDAVAGQAIRSIEGTR